MWKAGKQETTAAFFLLSRFPHSTSSVLPHCTLSIKAIPNAPRSEVVGWLGDALKVKVHAPPLEGRATEALCVFLADELDLPRRAITVLRGDTSRHKVLRIDGLSLAEVKLKLGV